MHPGRSEVPKGRPPANSNFISLSQIRTNVFTYLDLVLRIEAHLHKKSDVARSSSFLIHQENSEYLQPFCLSLAHTDRYLTCLINFGPLSGRQNDVGLPSHCFIQNFSIRDRGDMNWTTASKNCGSISSVNSGSRSVGIQRGDAVERYLLEKDPYTEFLIVGPKECPAKKQPKPQELANPIQGHLCSICLKGQDEGKFKQFLCLRALNLTAPKQNPRFEKASDYTRFAFEEGGFLVQLVQTVPGFGSRILRVDEHVVVMLSVLECGRWRATDDFFSFAMLSTLSICIRVTERWSPILTRGAIVRDIRKVFSLAPMYFLPSASKDLLPNTH